MASSTSSLLEASLASLRTSTDLLGSSLSILDSGISDLPRLSRVLTQTRHFELVPSSTLTSAQEAVLSELAPEVESLIARVEAHVEKLERREQGLRAKWDLQEGRLGREAQGGESAYTTTTRNSSTGEGRGKAIGPMQELKAKQLRQKKERLGYAVERLTLQAQQTERKLRMSMAAQEMTTTLEEPKTTTADDEDDLFD